MLRQLSSLFLLFSSCLLVVERLTDVPFCGDGALDEAEQCDDGNAVDDDGCTNQCLFFCGNQFAELGQACDGADLKGQSCASLDFDSGNLACLADCSDFDFSSCVAEVCTDGQDNGQDGLADCLDLQNCQTQCNDACESPTVVGDPAAVDGNTLNHSDQLTGSCQAAGGGEVAFAVTIQRSGVLRLSLQSATEQGVFVRSECANGAELGCIDAPDAELGVLATQGETLFIIVNASSIGQEGPFTLLVESAPVVCGDDILDAVAGEECEPPGSAICDANCKSIESDCNNQIDDDADNLLDCEDPNECQLLPECTPGATVTGGPCDAHNDCSTANGNDPFCFNEASNGFPAGYCSEFCSISQGGCLGDAVCVRFDDVNANINSGLCVDGCNPANGNADCSRAGYTCQDINGAQASFGCLPGCSNNAQCQVLAGCNIDTGFCVNTTEDCNINLDEDDDTLINCEDADCRANVALCPLAAECAAAGALQVNTAGNTVAGSDDFRGSCFVTGNAKEQIFSFTTPGNTNDRGFITLTLQSLTQQGAYIRSDCVDPASELACLFGAIPQTTEAPGGADLSVFVDAAFPGAEGPFTLTLRFDLISESEPNDSSAQANVFVDPFVAESTVANDEDFISVILPANILLSAQIDEIFEGDCVNNINSLLEIRDIDGTTVLDTSEVGCKPAVAFITQAGTYFIRVFGASSAFPYRLFVTQTSLTESENNDTAGTADVFVDGWIAGITAGDIDFVSFVITGANATLAAELTDVGSKDCALNSLDSQLRIFDTDGTTQLAFDDNNGAGNCSFVRATGLAAGTYFVRVTATGANVPYRLAVKQTTETEPNNSAAASNVFVDPFIGAIQTPQEEDFVQVNVPANGSLLIELIDAGDGACANNTIDSELELVGPGLAQSIVNDDKILFQDFCSLIDADNLVGGIYVIRVASSQIADNNGTFLYQLLVTVQ